MPSFFSRFFWRIKSLVRAGWCAVRPGPQALNGAAKGVVITAGLVYLAFAVTSAEGPLGPGAVVVLVELIAGALLLLLGQGVAKLVELFNRLPWALRWGLLGAVLLFNLALMGVKMDGAVTMMATLLLIAMLIGGGVGALAGTRWGNLTIVQRAVSVAGISIGALALAGGLFWYGLYRGAPEPAVVDAAATTGQALEKVSLPNPGQKGPYPVKTLTYGAGTDKFRPEFGKGAALKTTPVDGSKLLKGSWEGLGGQLRTLYWGFDPKALPLNGRVWYPESSKAGDRFPLILAAHGNHLASDFSDPGYAYLGELLASRGFIFVSVDENFLNGSPTDLLNSMKEENDARGWLLLEHLHAWDSWNRAAGNPFSGIVDMERIAVMGHSRGGEAAAIAAAFNRLAYYPDDSSQVFTYNFNIRAVVAIAPSDGQYAPAWRNTPLSNVDYFVLQGSHDSDVTSFTGLRQYERVRFDELENPSAPVGEANPGDYFKAALYIYRANHGQFNTVWGDNDQGMLRGGFLNRAALLSGSEQRQLAEVYLSAFFEAALRDQQGYLPLFEDARAAGAGWLPGAVYINRFDRAGDRMLATYEEDIDLTTATVAGARISAQAFTTWREQRIKEKWGGGETSAVFLAWNEEKAADYTIELPKKGFPVNAGDALIFNLADANQDPKPAGIGNGDAPASPAPGGPRQPIDLTVLLVDSAGHSAALPLSRYQAIQPQLSARLYKAALFEPGAPSEPILESYVLPLKDFVQVQPGFDPTQLKAIHFVFKRTPRGSVWLDAVGVR